MSVDMGVDRQTPVYISSFLNRSELAASCCRTYYLIVKSARRVKLIDYSATLITTYTCKLMFYCVKPLSHIHG